MEQTRCNDAERCYRDSNERGEVLQECPIKTWIFGRLDEGPQGDVSSPDNPFVFAEADGEGPTFEQWRYHQHSQTDRRGHDTACRTLPRQASCCSPLSASSNSPFAK